jgi:hypothetical protein
MAGHTALQVDDTVLAGLEARVLAQHLDDMGGIGSALQLVEDQGLVLVRGLIDPCLAGSHAFAGHYHSLHIL